MSTIVMNTINAAVTLHDIDAQSVSGDHLGSATGLYLLGAATDNGRKIPARVLGPSNDQGTSRRKSMRHVYFTIKGQANSRGKLLVVADGREYGYPMPVRSSGVSRASPGMGISATRIGLGFANEAGADFQLERIEAEVLESTRRLK